MKSLINKIYNVLFVCALCYSCAEMDTRVPLSSGNENIDKVKNAIVKENGAGYSLLEFEVPQVEGLKYILAEYKINPTTSRQTKVSISINKLRVEGFQNEGEYDVLLYAVNSSEKRSEPIVVKVHPKKPAYLKVFETLKIQQGFGGVSVFFNNPDTAKIAVGVVTTNKNNELYTTNTYYTETKEGVFATRGFEAEPRKFGVYVRDNFNNYSDTLYVELTPLLERQLEKSKFRGMLLPNDEQPAYGWVLSNLWDNNVGSGFHTPEPSKLPALITFDLGVESVLSRFKLWQRDGNLLFQWGNPREWVIYGSLNPNPNGELDETWIKLGEFVSKKPSGGVTNTAEDIAYAKAGEEFEFPTGVPAVRYLRFELKRSWSDSPRFHFMELTFWGS